MQRIRLAVGLLAGIAAACGTSEQSDPVEPAATSATEPAASTPSAPTIPPTVAGGIEAPPPVVVRGDATTLTLDAWTFCYANGCADGMPPEPLPVLGPADRVEVDFPLDGWTFEAAFQRAGDPCARTQNMALSPAGPTSFVLDPVGPAGTYDVTLFGRGDGDLFVSFEWTTTADGPLPIPDARLAVLADHDGRVDSYGVELVLSNLATSPTTATATITVTAADGRSLTFDAAPQPDAGQPCPTIEGLVSWDGPDDQGLAAAELGPPPFTYDVVVALDGTEHRATATWPDDQIPGNQPSVALIFDPPLPAVTG